ncbi:MAG: DUF935 family protein [Endomicrobiia bacterium]|nr:DUF935 family protein [Endomicrobiia bacterium]
MSVASLTAYKFQQESQEPQREEEFFIIQTEHLKANSSMYAGYAEQPYNPDVIAKKRPPFGIYDDMRRDDQVKAILWVKKFMVLSCGWDLEAEEEYEDAIAEIKTGLSEIESPDFGSALTNMLTHLDYGFSLTEPVFKVKDNTIKLQSLRTRAPHTFILHTDDFGNLSKIEQYTETDTVEIKPEGLMLLQHQYEFGIPYGTSDLQSAYRAWFSKDVVIKFWNIYLERFGNPFVVGKIPSTLSVADKNKLLDIFKNLQAKSGMVVPEGVEVDIKASPSGTTDFEKAVNLYNMMIARSMLIPDLIGIGGSETSGGSYALGSKHFEIFFLTIEKIRQDLERAINRYVLRPLLWWNYGLKNSEIKWKLHPIDKDDKLELLRIWSEAVRGNLWTPTDEEINHFRGMVKFPKGDIERPAPKPAAVLPFQKIKEIKTACHEKDGKRAMTVYEKKIDFARIDKDLDTFAASAGNKLVPPLVSIREGLIDAVQNGRIIEGKKVEKIPDLKLKYLKDLQLAWKAVLRDTFDGGYDSADNEIAKIKARKMQRTISASALFEETIADRSFFITGIIRDNIRKEAGIVILRGIENGSSTQEIIHQLTEFFLQNYTPSPTAQGLYPIESIPGRLETIIRTNILKAYNQGRQNFFEQAGDFIQGYQFSAILDDRTTPVCQRLDGAMYRTTDPYISKINPPLHFNCRSLLIPIVAGEDFTPDEHLVGDDILTAFDGQL